MAVFSLGSRPLRAALAWQAAVSAAATLIAGAMGGPHAALSAALGGGTIIMANVAYALVARLGDPKTAGATIRILVRAEATKIAFIVLELWLVFSVYRDVVPFALMGAFIAAVLVWPVAMLYKDKD